ncbi:MAG: class I SAM-dependent methyltransferase, partial [Pseudomonadota bacterium]
TSNARFEVADAGEHAFGEGDWDALFSRFGCMFFDVPAAAMGHLRSALEPGGRAALCVWCEPKFNPWAMIPASAANDVLGPAEKVPPGAPGPFGWATPDIFMPILGDAGWSEIAFAEHELSLPISAGDDPDPVERAITHMCRIGPLARRLEDHPDAEAEIRVILADALRPLIRDEVVMLGGKVRIITARA